MKVILLADVRKQGKKDQIIDVSQGYANNYLIKNHLAVAYSETSDDILKKEIKQREIAEENLINEMKVLKQKIESSSITFYLNAGSEGKLFGTVSSKQIKEKLLECKIDIKKSVIKIPTAIDYLGNYKVSIILHKKVVAELKIIIKNK